MYEDKELTDLRAQLAAACDDGDICDKRESGGRLEFCVAVQYAIAEDETP
jgi:hypothetical protein